ncbi:MAG: hypothetical protein V2A69_04145 [Pseudomonadota bacterium]
MAYSLVFPPVQKALSPTAVKTVVTTVLSMDDFIKPVKAPLSISVV